MLIIPTIVVTIQPSFCLYKDLRRTLAEWPVFLRIEAKICVSPSYKIVKRKARLVSCYSSYCESDVPVL